MVALYVAADQYQWARITLGSIVFIAFVLFLLMLR